MGYSVVLGREAPCLDPHVYSFLFVVVVCEKTRELFYVCVAGVHLSIHEYDGGFLTAARETRAEGSLHENGK